MRQSERCGAENLSRLRRKGTREGVQGRPRTGVTGKTATVMEGWFPDLRIKVCVPQGRLGSARYAAMCPVFPTGKTHKLKTQPMLRALSTVSPLGIKCI